MRLPDLLSFNNIQTLLFLEAVYRAIGKGKAYIDDNLVLGKISDLYIILCEEYSDGSDYESELDAGLGPDFGRVIGLIYDCINGGFLEAEEEGRMGLGNDSIPINNGSSEEEENYTVFKISQNGWNLLRKYAAEVIPQLIEKIRSDIINISTDGKSQTGPDGYNTNLPAKNEASFSVSLNSDIHLLAERQHPTSLDSRELPVFGSAKAIYTFSKMTYITNFSEKRRDSPDSSYGKINNVKTDRNELRDFSSYEKIIGDITDSMKPENYSRTLPVARNLFESYLGFVKERFSVGCPPGDRDIDKIIEILDNLERFVRAFRIRDNKKKEMLAILRDRLLRLKDLSALLRTDY